MCTPQTRRERIFNRWDATDYHMQQIIFDEFRKKHKGCYTQKELLNFLEKKLMRAPETVAISLNFLERLFA